MPMFKRAGAAEVLRAAQKDELYRDKLQHQVSDVLLKVTG